MAEIHRIIREHGKAKALQMHPEQHMEINAASAYMGIEEGDIGFLYSGQALAALPHKRLADDASWQIHTEHVSLVVQPGLRPCPTGEAVSVGVPYGSRARLICLYLQTESIKTNSREVELGKSLHAWLRRLEIPIGGKSMFAVKDQAERISRCRMTFQVKQGSRTGLVNQNIVDTAMFVEDDSTQGSLFIATAKLSEIFFEQLQKHPVPIEEHAIKQIANNSAAIDVYCWLAYRLHSLSGPMFVTWKALHKQFGTGMKRLDHFRTNFAQTLQLAVAVYPDAKIDVDGPGVTLHPSKPPVAPKIANLRRLKG